MYIILEIIFNGKQYHSYVYLDNQNSSFERCVRSECGLGKQWHPATLFTNGEFNGAMAPCNSVH